MWCIYFLYSVLLVIYAACVITAYGIKLQIRMDYNNLSVCIRVYILDWIEVMSFKIFEWQGQFYYSFNRKEINQIKAPKGSKNANKRKDKSDMRKVNYFALAGQILDDMPNIRLKEIYIQYNAGDDEMVKSVFGGGLVMLENIIRSLLGNKIKVDRIINKDISGKSPFVGVIAEAVIGLDLIKILFYLLHIIALKKKYTIENYA